MKEMKLNVISADWHRNGISGVGFYAIIFDWINEQNKKVRMIATLFEESGYCAIFSIEELVKGNIDFARGNSWRGDQFEEVLRPLIKKIMKKKEDELFKKLKEGK